VNNAALHHLSAAIACIPVVILLVMLAAHYVRENRRRGI